MIEIDHVALPARDSARSARALAELLGDATVTPEGPDGDMHAVHVDNAAMVLFMDAEQTPRQHLALRVDGRRFTALVARLGQHHRPYGNDPAAPDNGRSDDCLGAGGRVYFDDPDGHLIEVVTADPAARPR